MWKARFIPGLSVSASAMVEKGSNKCREQGALFWEMINIAQSLRVRTSMISLSRSRVLYRSMIWDGCANA
jgi:hypothetical protein